MRPRFAFHRLPVFQYLRPLNAPRLFTENTLLLRSRAQLPFLAIPARKPKARLITTETKQWVKKELRDTVRYTAYIWIGGFLVLTILYGIKHERWERQWPTPSEWRWFTRRNCRQSAHRKANPDRLLQWSLMAYYLETALNQLEDPNIDGQGIQEREEGGIYIDGVGKTGYDITAKSEQWRRGYYEVLMGCAECAEHLVGWVRIIGERFAWPQEVVLGPSNPDPQPVLPGSLPAPRDDEIEPAFYPPETFYMRILTTEGFNQKQKMDAALGYGVWLDHQGLESAAMNMYQWALDIAMSTSPEGIIDRATEILSSSVGLPSQNLLSATTALAVHHALHQRVTTALPILVSVLRARKSLPLPEISQSAISNAYDMGPSQGFQKYLEQLKEIIISPDYPSPPPDGTAPPIRDSQERCEEAGVINYIGEILFTLAKSKAEKEEAVSWIREAVDITQGECRGKTWKEKETWKLCVDCLVTAMHNWQAMIVKGSNEEKLKVKKEGKGWFFNEEKFQQSLDRWASEGQVYNIYADRTRELTGMYHKERRRHSD